MIKRTSIFVGAIIAKMLVLVGICLAQDKPWASTPPLAVAPFGTAEAHEHQEAWAKHLGRPRATANVIGMQLMLIPAGEFTMGSPPGEKDRAPWEGPQHRVRLREPFYLGVYDVTVKQFAQFARETGYRTDAECGHGVGFKVHDGSHWEPQYNWRNTGLPQTDVHPVVDVSWNDAVAFCRWLSRKDGKRYGLPTEAQWEFACRAGTTTPFSFGSALNGREANCRGDYPYGTAEAGSRAMGTTPVGSYRANAFGLFDMHGNVAQWCADGFDPEYYTTSPADDPTALGTGVARVLRGGGWFNGASGCRSACRCNIGPTSRDDGLGFRVAGVVD